MSIVNLPIKKMTTFKTTWSNKPASPQVGQRIIVTDIGSSDEAFIWNGTRWAPVNGQIQLASVAANASVTGTTTNTQLYEVIVPAGLMSPNGQLEIVSAWSYTNSANNKTLRLYFGLFGFAAYISRGETTTTSCQYYTTIRNSNSLTSQVGLNGATAGGIGASSNTIPTSNRDTTQAQSLLFGAQLAVGTETITLKGLKVTYRD